jgi:hypothetical protein
MLSFIGWHCKEKRCHSGNVAAHATWWCRDESLQEMLNDYKERAGLSVHWVHMGPSGVDKRPAAGGVLRHYTKCEGHGNPKVKTIANTYYLENISPHAHNFQFRYGSSDVHVLALAAPRLYRCACE